MASSMANSKHDSDFCFFVFCFVFLFIICGMIVGRQECFFWIFFILKFFKIDRFMTACFDHVTYVFQSESALYSRLNVKELLERGRRKIWSLSDCNWTRTHNYLVRKRKLNHLAKQFIYELCGCVFDSSCVRSIYMRKKPKILLKKNYQSQNRKTEKLKNFPVTIR